MSHLSLQIARPIFIAGMFAVVSLWALGTSVPAIIFYGMVFLLVVFLYFFSWHIADHVSLPIKKLLIKVDSVNRGDVGARYPLKGRGEVARLANTFNQVAEKLEASLDQQLKIKRSSAAKASFRAQSLREVIYALDQKVKNRTMDFHQVNATLAAHEQMVSLPEASLISLESSGRKVGKKRIRNYKA